MAQQPTATTQGLKKIKKGELLFKEGDKADFIYVVQSGRVQLSIIRPSSNIKIYKTNGVAIVGELALTGSTRHPFTAEAVSDVTALEMPVAVFKSQYEKLPAIVQTVIKSLLDENKSYGNEVKSSKLEKEATPCPHTLIPRVFLIVNLIAKHSGKMHPDSNAIELSWESLKLFGARILMESAQRLEGLMQILEKLEYVELIFEKDEEGHDVLARIMIKDLQVLEDFAEFFHYNLYKPGVNETILYDDITYKVTDILVQMTEGLETDRHGAVKVDYNEVVTTMVEAHKLNFKLLHVELLEKKGLFMKRTVNGEEVFLSFDRVEFAKMVKFWGLLNEINKWNQRGKVLSTIEELKLEKIAKGAKNECGECEMPYQSDAKFCSNCGAKVSLKAA